MRSSFTTTTVYSTLGSIGAHLIFIVLAGNLLLSQDRPVLTPNDSIKLKVVKKIPLLKKKPIREISRQRIETSGPIKHENLPKAQKPFGALEISPTKQETPMVKQMEQNIVQTPTVAPKKLLAKTSVSTRFLNTNSITPRNPRVEISKNIHSSRTTAVNDRATRLTRTTPKIRVPQPIKQSTSARSKVTSLASKAVRTPHSNLVPKRFQIQSSSTTTATSGKQIISGRAKRANTALFQTKVSQSDASSQKGKINKENPLQKISPLRVSLPYSSPKKLENVKSTFTNGTLKTSFLSSGAKRLDFSDIESRPIPYILDQRVLQGYSRGIQRKISAKRKYPKKAKRDGKQGRVTVRFTVLKSGEIKDLILVTRTPYEELNKAGLDAVRQAAPFSKLPEEIEQDYLVLELPFKFEIK